MVPVALSIAGSDPSGGAGVQADLRTFHSLGVYGLGVITSVTVQNTQGVYKTLNLEPRIVYEQITKLLEDVKVKAVKIGMLGSGEIILEVSKALKGKVDNLVLDTPILSKNKFPLLDKEAIHVLKSELIPISTIVTPNLHEAELLSGINIASVEDIKASAESIQNLGAESVIIKGGHFRNRYAIDYLLYEGEFYEFKSERLPFQVRGTGCVFASAIASFLATGLNLLDAVGKAKEFITSAIRSSVEVGKGYRVMPLNKSC